MRDRRCQSIVRPIFGCILTLFLRKGQAGSLPYFEGGLAANVGQRFQPVRAKGNFQPNYQIKNSVKMHPLSFDRAPLGCSSLIRFRLPLRASRFQSCDCH